MKNLKLVLFSVLFSLLIITSCTNNEPIGESLQQTEESPSISTALNELRAKFNDSGNVNESENPSGNIVLDFCFDFVYPLNLSYNNGTSVTVQSLDGLIEIMLASTEELYISGIAFPFNVETYDESTNAIAVVTINNEEEFVGLLESCQFDSFESCDCFEDYNPVCVEINDPNGDTFVVTYPNACYAECDGFTADDFLESCEGDYYSGGGFECFELNFPISVVTENNEIITIESEEDLNTALYGVYIFDFVYPFSITLENQTVMTINGPEDIEVVLADCYGNYYGGGDDECVECLNLPLDPVCVQYTTATGETIIEVYPNACFAECEGFTADDFVDCENAPSCNEDTIVNALVECQWQAISSVFNPNQENVIATFNADGSVAIDISGTVITGTWETTSSPNTGEVFMFFVIPEPFDTFSTLDWTVVECDNGYLMLVSGTESLILVQECN